MAKYSNIAVLHATVNFQPPLSLKTTWEPFFCAVAQAVPQPPLGDCLKKKKTTWKPDMTKRKYSSCRNPWLNVDWLIDICSEGFFFCLQEEKRWFQTLSWFSHSCLVWIYLSVMNYFKCHSIGFKGGNYFSAPWNSTNPLLGVCDTSFVTPLVTAAFFYQVFRKLRVMHAAKQPLKQRPRLLGSLTMRLLRSGTTDEQSLVSYRAPR